MTATNGDSRSGAAGPREPAASTDIDGQRAERTLSAVERAVQHLVELTHKLEALARMQMNDDNPVIQEMSASTIAQLRSFVARVGSP